MGHRCGQGCGTFKITFCGGDDFLSLPDIKKYYRINKEENMELFQQEHSLIDSFNKLAEIYDDTTDDFSHEIIHYIHTQNMANEFPPPGKDINLLDLGGGTGKYSIILSKMGYNVTLADISDQSLEIARINIEKENLNIKILNSSGENLPIENEAYDIIVMIGGVINYTPNPEKLIQECKRVLKKGGILYFDFMNTMGWGNEIPEYKFRLEIIEAKTKLIQMDDWDYPARLFNCKYMEEIIKNTGLKIKSKYGLLNAVTSLPLNIRYGKEYDEETLKRYKKKELELSRDNECYGTSWSCIIAAIK